MRRPAFGVLDRYVLRELVAPFGLGLVLFTFFLFLDRLYDLTELVITKGVPFYLVVQLLVFMLPAFLSYTLPMALLVAVLLAGGRLAADLEIVAFQASGVSVLRLFRPVLVAALAVAAATAGLTTVATPLANREFQRQLFDILRSRAVAGLQERVFNTSFGDTVVYVEEISPSQVALRHVLVSDERDPRLARVITAREGRLLTDEARRRVTLRLIDGAVNETDTAGSERGHRPPPAAAEGAPGQRYRYTSFAIYDMTLTVDSTLKRSISGDKPERDLTLPALLERLGELAGDPLQRRAHQAELHKRLAFPLAALIFALAAFPLAVRSHRGGRAAALVAALVILLSYYLLLTSLEGPALRGHLPVWLAVWLPNLLFGLLGVALLAGSLREWRPPRLPGLWRALEGLRPRRRRGRRRREARATLGRGTSLIMDRYLLRQYAGFLAMGLGVTASLVVVVHLLQKLDRYLRVKPPLIHVAEHLMYEVPTSVYQGLPVVMLVATVFLFLTLSRWHELTALKAAGISLYRTSAPILLFGVLVAAGAGLFQEFVMPTLEERGEEVERVKIRGQLPRHLRSRTRLWLRASDTRFYRVELLSPASSELYGVTILDLGPGFQLRSRLDARRALWTPGGWELTEGAIREIGRDGQVTTLPFTHTTLDLGETIRDFTEIQKPASAMSYRELREYVARLEAAGFQARKYLVDLHAKLSDPLKNFIMVLVAIPLALQAPRGGRVYGIALAIVIMAAYLVVDYSARAFARAELLPPLLAAWTANVVFLGLGASLFLRART